LPAAGYDQGMNPAATALFEPTEAFARRMDEADPLARFRERFCLPRGRGREQPVYFAGNSLGLMPRAAREAVGRELEDWAALGVEAHLQGRNPWFSYHEAFAASLARLVGALPEEVVAMNALTVNIHLMLVSFYRPQGMRRAILIEHPAFPSDLYAVRSHVRSRGLDPDECVITARPRPEEHALHMDEVEALIEERGREIALVWLPGVNYFTGQVFDMARLTAAAHRQGCLAGWDLAHAIGNVPMSLHDWGADVACWCSYKYLNGGPGAVGGAFVHEKHWRDGSPPRLAGWWGDDPETRFQMHLKSEFHPQPGAAGWQVSNPPILSMAPLRAALEIFDEAGIEALRAKSLALSGYLRRVLEHSRPYRAGAFEIITPAESAAHGCQLSILSDSARALHAAALERGAVCDFREPDVIRAAPVPLYNTFHEAWRFARILLEAS
jgi:kynureninase